MNMPRIFLLPALMLSTTLMLGGCLSVPPVPEDNFYRLPVEIARIDHKPNTVFSGTVAVRRLKTDGLHNGRAILYSEPERLLELRQYHYHHWLDIPPRLLQEHLVSYLRRVRAAPRVISFDPRTQTDFVISGKIRRFEQIRSAGGSEVVVDLELRLERGNESGIVLVDDYTAKLPVRGSTMHDVVRSFAQALDTIYRAFLNDVPAGTQVSSVRGQATSSMSE